MPEYRYLKAKLTHEQIEDSLRIIEGKVGDLQMEVVAVDLIEADNGKFTRVEVRQRDAKNGVLPELHVKTVPAGPSHIDDYADDGVILVDYADIFIEENMVPTVLFRNDPSPQPMAGYKTIKGVISVFGGPRDQGVKPDEGLALITPAMRASFGSLFLSSQPPGTTGLARRLNNEGAHYIACRWNYKETPADFLRRSKVQVSYEGKQFDVQPVDWGPNAKTGRVADLSDKLADDLGVRTDREIVTVRIPVFGTSQHLDALDPTPAPSSGGPQARYDARTQANIQSLEPSFGTKVQQWLAVCRQNNLNPLIHFGTRSIAEQTALYQKHLNGGPKAVQPKRSYHCYGRAIDWVHVANASGGASGLAWNDSQAYALGTQLAQQFGITGISGDSDHLQDALFPNYSSLPASDFGRFA